jgi:hypothetical protein
MSSPSLPLPQHVLIAVDIERTGDRFVADATTGQRDEILSIGFALFDAERAAPPFHTVCIGHRLERGADESWRDLWVRRGYSLACYDELWAKYPEALERTQTMPPSTPTASRVTARSRADLAALLNALLADFERTFASFRYVVDTTENDRTWLAVLLQEHGFPTLSYRRDGTFRWGAGDLHSGSYELGRVGGVVRSAATKNAIELMRCSFDFSEMRFAHDAVDDAIEIGCHVLAAMHYKKPDE